MKFLRNRLAKRIVTLMILASALLSVFAASVQLYFSYRSDLARIMGEIETIEQSFLHGLENALWQFNFPQVEVLVEGIYAPQDIVAVKLTSTTGQIFERGDDTSPDTLVRAFDLVYTQANGRQDDVGTLSVSLSLENIRHRLRNQFLTLVASNLLKTLAASILMLFIFERMVSRHLRTITTFVSQKDWDTNDETLRLDSAASDTPDDLHNIVHALNRSKQRILSGRSFAGSLTRRLEAVLNAATSGIVAFDSAGQVVMLNPRAQHMLGLLGSELPHPWPKSISFLDRANMTPLDASRNPIQRVLVGQALINETSIMSRHARDRDPRYVRISSASVVPDEISDIRAVVVIDDVSEQEKNRQQIERSGRLDALGQLTGGVAHDFNNLLATISYAMDLAQKTDDDAKRSKYIETATASVQRGSALTKRLLAFAKQQPGDAESRLVSAVLDEFESLARPTIEEAIQLQIVNEAKDLRVFCDIAQLENALLNLVINARDAILRTGDNGKIILTARGIFDIAPQALSTHTAARAASDKSAHGDLNVEIKDTDRSYRFIEFTVSDDGSGMDEEIRRRALDPFFTTKETNSGTGLGLSMVYGFVKQAGGQIGIYSEKGLGTTVRLHLPRGLEDGGREDSVDRSENPQGQGQTILIVEDETHLAELLGEVVTSLGYNVLHADRG